MSRTISIIAGGGFCIRGGDIIDAEAEALQAIKDKLPTIKTITALNDLLTKFKALSSYKQADFLKTCVFTPGIFGVFLDQYLDSIDVAKLKELFAAPWKEYKTIITSEGQRRIGAGDQGISNDLYITLRDHPVFKYTFDKFTKKINGLDPTEFLELSKTLVSNDLGEEVPLGCLVVLRAEDLEPYITKLHAMTPEEQAEFLALSTPRFSISQIFKLPDDTAPTAASEGGGVGAVAEPDIGALSLTGEEVEGPASEA